MCENVVVSLVSHQRQGNLTVLGRLVVMYRRTYQHDKQESPSERVVADNSNCEKIFQEVYIQFCGVEMNRTENKQTDHDGHQQ